MSPRTSRDGKQASRLEKLAAFDRRLRVEAGGLIAGIDEAGRGPLAGPVVAAAVVLPEDALLEGVDDSKRLSPARREEARRKIELQALAIGVGVVGPRTIDVVNILQATLRAARLAVQRLDCPVRLLMTDYLKLQTEEAPTRWEAKADAKSLSVAAASIVAKTVRDAMMAAYSEEYPGYAFERNKGYGSPGHLEALERQGPCSLHRLSFAGVTLFDREVRPSLSFAKLRDLRRGAAPQGEFRAAARRLLDRADVPLPECEARQARRWIEGA
jgi:ribonuclease HII